MNPNFSYLPYSRLAIIKAILRGETLTTFETAVAENQKGADGAILDLTMDMLNEALAEVTTSIFPTGPWTARNSG